MGTRLKTHKCLTLIFLFTFACLLIFNQKSMSQELNWNSISIASSQPTTGLVNGLNMGGYSYAYVNMQGENISLPDECVECLDFDCSSLLTHENVTGSSFQSMDPKPNFVAQTKTIKPGILRFPGGTHSGWYHFYQYDINGVYDASNPTISKGYGMKLGETIHLTNPYSYCKMDTRLQVNENYIQGFVNLMNDIQDGEDFNISVTYVANLLTHFDFPAVQLPILFSCTSTCGRTKALTPMENYICSQKFEYSYLGNETLFNNDPDVYRFELYYKETQDAIEYLVDSLNLQPNQVLYVEMGNEYYDNESTNSSYPNSKYQMTAVDYAKLVEIYSERLKCYFDGRVIIKTGIISKPNRTWQSTTNIFNINYPGLVNLLSEDLSGNGQTLTQVIDGVILHEYYNSSDCLDIDDIDERFTCAKETFRDFIDDSGELVTSLDNLKVNFPNQKVWLTEWNALNGTDSKNLNFLNTPFHAAWVLEYALKLLEYNSVNQNVVEIATHHRLGFDRPWSIIQTIDGDNDAAIVRASAYSMKYISKLYYYDNFNFIGNILEETDIEYDTKEAKTFVFFQQADASHLNDKLLVYFTNKTDNDINNTLPVEIDNLTISDAKISYLHGEKLFSYGPSNGTQGRNHFQNSTGTYYDEDLNTLGYGPLNNSLEEQSELPINTMESFVFPANSIGVLEIEFQNPNNVEIRNSKLEVSVFPNPVKDNIKIKINGNTNKSLIIEILDMNGKVLRQEPVFYGNGTLNINLAKLGSGIYFVKVMNNENIIFDKFVKL